MIDRGLHYVYIIEDYAGISQVMVQRKRMHKGKRNTENWQVVKAFTDREEARDYEAHLHDKCGYKGKYVAGDRSKHVKTMTGRNRETPWLNTKVVIDGIEYKSLREAERQTGVSRYWITKLNKI